MNALRTAIYSKATSSSSFNTSIGGRFYFDKAPQTPTYPFVVAHEIVNNYDFTFQEDYEVVRVQFSIYSKSSSNSECGTIYDNLRSLFDWCQLSVTGYRFLKSQRSTSMSFWDDKKLEYVYTVDYTFTIQKS